MGRARARERKKESFAGRKEKERERTAPQVVPQHPVKSHFTVQLRFDVSPALFLSLRNKWPKSWPYFEALDARTAAKMGQILPDADIPIIQAPEGPEGKFPMQAGPDDLIKIPGQTRVDRDEYQEFLALGHGGIFDLDLNRSALQPAASQMLAGTIVKEYQHPRLH